MNLTPPFNLNKWIDEHRHLLKPPVGNQQVYHEVNDFIVMVVGGPNSRKDFHYNETEELFLQLEGDAAINIIWEGKPQRIELKEGDMFLLPAKVPHSPQRGPNTVGLVIERVRSSEMKDSFSWYCEKCGDQLYEVFMPVKDIVKELPPVMNAFYEDASKCTCKSCGSVMLAPQKHN